MKNDKATKAQIPLSNDEERRYHEWTTEMKITLITYDNEERAKGRDFMNRVSQKLLDNAFKKQPEVIILVLVRRRSEITARGDQT